MENIEISTGFIKLGQLLKLSGAAQSGVHAKAMIEEGMVFVNNEKVFMRGKKIFPGDEIKLISGESYKVTGGL
ncbi:MAG: RNA-binding S4 domain-containing protein [Lachnospiraceae bacterium]|nr:RNA-binding S4 domain-containing protein [Lachnospiraceae bacterium]